MTDNHGETQSSVDRWVHSAGIKQREHDTKRTKMRAKWWVSRRTGGGVESGQVRYRDESDAKLRYDSASVLLGLDVGG